MPTRILSWEQLVLEEDPDWSRSYRRPRIYDFSNGRLFYARDPLYGPFEPEPPPPPILINSNGLLELSSPAFGWPVSPIGLLPGAVWNNNQVVSVVPGITPDPLAPPVFFGTITSTDLLLLGGGDMPTSDPLVLNQIWNNAGNLNVSAGPPIPPPVITLINNNGVLELSIPTPGWPISPLGLLPGAVWNNSQIVSVVPGITPDPLAPPIYFGVIASSDLLLLGGGNMPLTDPGVLNQIWNNGGNLNVSIGPPPPPVGLINNGGVLELTVPATGWPTSPTGLPLGAVWNNNQVVTVVPGVTPNPAAPPVFFGVITASDLLALGGGNMPLTDPHVLNQIWSNSGHLNVSFGPAPLPAVLLNSGGVLRLSFPATGWPTSSIGLPAGAVWNNSQVVSVVPGVTPNPMATPVFFGVITASDLLLLGGGDMPLFDPLVLNQIWNNAGNLNVSFGPPPPTLINDNGLLELSSPAYGWPVSSIGLSPGAVWNDGQVVTVVPGVTPNPSAPAVFFGVITSTNLLLLGGGNMPTSDPLVLNQIWNNGGTTSDGGVLCVSAGPPTPPAVTLLNNGGVLELSSPTPGWPTSDMGLPPGALWNDGQTIPVVRGLTPNPAASPVFFGAITAADLLLLGGGNMPFVDPGVPNQIWNNGGGTSDGGILCVSVDSSGLASDGGVLQLTNLAGWPTSDAGLPAGAVWNDHGAVAIVPGGTPDPLRPVFFGAISSVALLAQGAGSWPTTDPHALNQLWNNGNEGAISNG